MLEYVFFDEDLRDRFVAFVREKGADCVVSDDGGLVAAVPEDLDDELADAIDYRYEQLLQENADLLDAAGEAFEKSAAGVQVQLSDGSPCLIRIDPNLMARILTAIDLEELRDMVQSIAAAVEHPDDRPLCHG